MNSSTVTDSQSITRRHFFSECGYGIGKLALAGLLTDVFGKSTGPVGTHFAPRAKRVIWLFMHGGPSQVDLFDPKPDLTRLSGEPLPESFGEVMTRRKVATNPLLAPAMPFRR